MSCPSVICLTLTVISKVKMILKVLLPFLCIQAVTGNYQPGDAGAPWTAEEIDIVRDKLVRLIECSDEAAPDQWTPHEPTCWLRDDLPDKINDGSLDDYTRDLDDYGPHKDPADTWNRYHSKWNSRRVTPSRLVQLAFHDCLRYEDGTGGCDGCLNWAGMGWMSESMEISKNDPRKGATPTQFHTTNNKLQVTVRSLELIYTVPDWPPGAKVLSQSLKESGKSRADLWQFAGNFGLEKAIQSTNDNGKNATLDRNTEAMLCAIEGRDKCETKLDRPIPFRTGRKDCIPEQDKKWTPYAFEATKKEKHSNPHGTGISVIQDLKIDFGLTARESIALFAVHGLSKMGRNHEEALKYKWIGGMTDSQRMSTTTFSNMYHKFLNGKTYDRPWEGRKSGRKSVAVDENLSEHGMFCSAHCNRPGHELLEGFQGYYVGDANGDPVGKSAFSIGCTKQWTTPGRKAGGPCHFRPLNVGSWQTDNNPDHVLRAYCFDQGQDGSFVRKADKAGCESAEIFEKDGFFFQRGGPQVESWSRLSSGWQFMLPFEAGLIVDFQVDPVYNVPYGCGAINGSWVETRIKPVPTIPIYPGSPAHESNPGCQFVTYAPEGEALPDIVEKFADDHDDWQKTFFNAWEKMQQNGYDDKLVSAPSNGNLLGVKGPVGVPCVDKATSDFCNFRNQQRCKNKWWYPKSQCMATCGYCETDSNVPCKDFDESADCTTMKADGKCELDGKGGEIARFRCFKTCTGC